MTCSRNLKSIRDFELVKRRLKDPSGINNFTVNFYTVKWTEIFIMDCKDGEYYLKAFKPFQILKTRA